MEEGRDELLLFLSLFLFPPWIEQFRNLNKIVFDELYMRLFLKNVDRLFIKNQFSFKKKYIDKLG